MEKGHLVTLLELLKLLKLHLKSIVIVTIVCAVVGFGGTTVMAKVSPSYSATASVVVSSGSVGATGGIASSVAQSRSTNGVSVKATTNSSSSTISIVAKGSSASACLNAANGTANELAATAKDQEAAKATTVSLASSAKNESPSATKYGLVAGLGGLFVIVCIVVAIDSVKRRVHDWRPIEESTGLRFLGKLDDDPKTSNLIETNLLLSCKKDDAGKHSSGSNGRCFICLIPAGKTDKAAAAANTVASASLSGKIASLEALPSLVDAPYTLLDHSDADAFAVVVEEEVTNYNDIELVIREFKIAGIEPAGFIYCAK